MPTTNFSALLPEVSPEMPDCMDAIMINSIRKSAIRFCEETYAWEVDLDPIVMVANVAEYEIDQPIDQRIIRISQVIGSKGQIFFQSEADMDVRDRNWRVTTGDVVCVPIMISPIIMRMYPIPAASGEIISMKGIVKPSPTSLSVATYIYDDYYTGLAAGAKAELAAMPGKSWSNPNMVLYYQGIFNQAVTDAKMRRTGGFADANRQVAYKRFGG